MWGKRACFSEEAAANQRVCTPTFERNRGGLPAETHQFCSEARNARVRVEHIPCPLPALQRSLASSCTAHEGVGCRSVSGIPGRLTGVSSAIASPRLLGPRPTWRGGTDWLSPNCQVLEKWELSQRQGKSHWIDFQALAWLSSLCTPRRERGPLCPLGQVHTFTDRLCVCRSQGCV